MSGRDDHAANEDGGPGVRPDLHRRAIARISAQLDPSDERLYGERKAALIGDLRGKILDVGAGAGANSSYLRGRVEYVALEPAVEMHPHIRAAAAEGGLAPHICSGAAESLPFPDASFDNVLATLVLCSVDDVDRALAEIRRVLRPRGRFVFLEHVAAPEGSWRRRLQRALRRPWRRIADGCNADRETWRAIGAAPFRHVHMECFSVPALLLRPHIAGWAQP